MSIAEGMYKRMKRERDAYKQRVEELEQFIRDAPVSTGVCCCGDNMENHPMTCGHSPVDEWDHASQLTTIAKKSTQ